jgi:hypothetical protein
MPNWCTNKLFFTGPEEYMDDLLCKAMVSEGSLKLSLIVPMTGGIRGIAEEIPFEEEECSIDGHSTISLEVITAWEPPLSNLTAIAQAYPKIKFTCVFAEPGMGIYGRTEWFNNDVLSKGLTLREYSEQFDEDYKAFMKKVKRMSAKRLLNEYAGRDILYTMHDQEHYAEGVAEALLKKVPTKYLPLLFSTVWPSDGLKAKYISRISNNK